MSLSTGMPIPALKKHGFSATLFVYTDFVGSGTG
jgi:hypothetical protein